MFDLQCIKINFYLKEIETNIPKTSNMARQVLHRREMIIKDDDKSAKIICYNKKHNRA